MRVFLSYGRRDADVAQALRNALSSRGFEVVEAQGAISPGDSIAGRITELLRTADAVIPILSRSSDQRSWMDMEIALAMAQRRTRVIPIVLSKDAIVPPVLQDRRAIVLSERRIDDRVIEALTTALHSVPRDKAAELAAAKPAGAMLFEEYKAELEVEKRQHEMQGRARVRQLSWYLSASFFVILTTLSVVFYLFPTERPTGAEALKLAVSLAAALAGYALGRLRPDKRTSGDSVSKASRR